MSAFPQTMRRAFAAAAAACALAACKEPNGLGAAGFGIVTGRVVDLQTRLPITGAAITVGTTTITTAASDQGGFVLRNVPVGAQPVLIAANGWQRYNTTITVTRDATTDVGVIALPTSLTAP